MTVKKPKPLLVRGTAFLLIIAAIVILLARVLLPLVRPTSTPEPAQAPQDPARNPARSTAPTLEPTPADLWYALFQRTPFPYTTPLPPPEDSLIDGPYVKFDPDEPQWWHCRRCEDYIPAGGIWRMHLDNGIYRIFYDVTNWKSLASFALEGDRLYLFNDPNCPDTVGIYNWRLEDGERYRELVLELVEDSCAIELRGKNLSKQPWLSCLPPNTEAAITDHWEKPPGCER
jgi:hypothetical protein